MLCDYCCKTLQVSPTEELDLKPATVSHKYVKLKNNKTIHVLHVNERQPTLDSVISPAPPASTVTAEFVYTTEPKRTTTNINETVTDISLYVPSSHEPSVAAAAADSAPNYTDLEQFDIFTKLMEYSKFDVKRAHGLNYLSAEDMFGCSLYYKNRIKLINSISGSVQNAQTMPEQQSKQLLDEKPMLFFIHGVGGSSRIWLKQLSYFSQKGYEIIAVDLIGHGLSSKSDDVNSYQFLEMALDVLMVFDMYARSENIAIGHSYGCSFATYLAKTRPSLVTKLVLISGGSPYPLGRNRCSKKFYQIYQ